MSASVTAFGQPGASVCKHLSEGVVAHHDMRDRQSFRMSIAIGRSEPDQVHEILVDNNADFVDEQRGLRHLYPLQQGKRPIGALVILHGGNRLGTDDLAGCTGIQRNGFQALSLLAPADVAPLGHKTSEDFIGHGYTRLEASFMLLSAKRRQFGPQQKPNYIFLDCLNTKPGHEKTGQRLRLRQFGRAVVTVLFHVRKSLTNSASRERARDRRRPCAGMVAPLPSPVGMVGHLSFSSAQTSSSPFISVAGNGDSNVPFGPLGNVFAGIRKIFGISRKSFGACQPRRSSNV